MPGYKSTIVLLRWKKFRALCMQKDKHCLTLLYRLRIDRNTDMGYVTDIQQELRKAFCLRINYSANVKI